MIQDSHSLHKEKPPQQSTHPHSLRKTEKSNLELKKKKSVSKIFTEFTVQQNTCLFSKPSAKNPNASWLLLSHNAALPPTQQPRKALARQQLVSVLPAELFAHQAPQTPRSPRHRGTHTAQRAVPPALTRLGLCHVGALGGCDGSCETPGGVVAVV